MINVRKLSRVGRRAKWHKGYIGCIKYSSYWGKFSLILDVTDNGTITELDGFGEINNTHGHEIRVHCTALDPNDAILTVADFYAQLTAGE